MGLDPEAHRLLLIQAAQVLLSERHYDVAADLLTAGSKGHAEAIALLAQAQFLRGVRRHETIPESTKSPEEVVRKFMRATLSGSASKDAIRALLAPAVTRQEDEESLGDAVFVALTRVKTILHNQFGSMDPILDLISSQLEVSAEGTDEIGFRVRTWFKGRMSQLPSSAGYVVRVGDEYRIVGFEPQLSTVGLQILEFVEQERVDAARQWLDWVHENLPRRPADDPLWTHPLLILWRPGETSDADDLRQAAAALVVSELDNEEARNIVEAGRATAEGDRRAAFDSVIVASAEHEGDRALTLRSARALVEHYPDSDMAFAALIKALSRSEKWEEAETLLDERLEARPRDPAALRLAADLAMKRDRHEEARRHLRTLVDTGKAIPGDYNNLAWMEVVLGQVTEETLIQAQQAVMAGGSGSAASLHTLATVYAELDRPDEARDVLLKVVDSRIDDVVEPHDWYVLGRMAESYELPQVAAEAYAKVEPPETDPPGGSTYLLAQRQLAKLDRARKTE
jgi:Flp pilus assembly protein TadD